MIHFDDKAAGAAAVAAPSSAAVAAPSSAAVAAPSSAAVAAPSFLPRIQAPPELRRNVALSFASRRLMDALKDLE
jgi:hypothetical protein